MHSFWVVHDDTSSHVRVWAELLHKAGDAGTTRFETHSQTSEDQQTSTELLEASRDEWTEPSVVCSSVFNHVYIFFSILTFDPSSVSRICLCTGHRWVDVVLLYRIRKTKTHFVVRGFQFTQRGFTPLYYDAQQQ